MALALAHPRTAPATHRTTRDDLTASQLLALDTALELLGTAWGLIEDQPPVTDAGHRQHISTAAARSVAITITPGHEIAQCHDCPTILDGAYAEEDEGRIRCEPCRETWARTGDPDYGLPDTTWDY